jgi:hypothetical protein
VRSSQFRCPLAGLDTRIIARTEALFHEHKVRAAKSTTALTKALDACDATAATVTAKLKALTLAQTRYEVALSARDKLLPAWSRSLARLKKKAAGAWVDEEETYRAVFAAPDAVRAPVAKRPKKPGTPK